MKDPVLEKLKTDAGIVLVELWRALRPRPVKPGRLLAESRLPVEAAFPPEMPEPPRDGLCYFHLN